MRVVAVSGSAREKFTLLQLGLARGLRSLEIRLRLHSCTLCHLVKDPLLPFCPKPLRDPDPYLSGLTTAAAVGPVGTALRRAAPVRHSALHIL